MIVLIQAFTVAVGLAVIVMLVVALAAIWESVRGDREFRKLERERRRAAEQLTDSERPARRVPR
jgi:uncharacterized membrane protein YccC